MRPIDETHDPARRSWVASANGHADFPIQNLPFGVFRHRARAGDRRIGVAIGDEILDLVRCRDLSLFDDLSEGVRHAIATPTLNALMALGPEAMARLRRCLGALLDARSDRADADERLVTPMSDAELLLPAAIGDYTDFYTSIDHATNVGHVFRPAASPLFPNFKYLPVGYHGRSSSIVPSGTPIVRPTGQSRAADAAAPSVGPSQRLDYELEIGAFVGPGNDLSRPIPLRECERHLFGLCLLNDWSARDLQAWESQPLGPFLAKSFATSISPLVVTLEALAPYRCPAAPRRGGDPAPLPYLLESDNESAGGFDIRCEVFLETAAMRAARQAPVVLSRNAFSRMYWTLAQMVAHHTSNGCNLRPGDLLGSGTISGPSEGELGCLLELTRANPIRLPNGEQRTFLADGDTVIFRARCARDGCATIGFGECRGTVIG